MATRIYTIVCLLSRNKNLSQNRSVDSQEIAVLWKINKEDSSPSLRCVHCPKVEIFIEMFCAKIKEAHRA